ncbi:MAG: phosphate transporter periplasmic phosphate-binding protein [Candidatus Eremiobacteraeota bacterium]|jgi:phosphate transport system substrate-binding protein|nr:phosphate transporter periplasmic phosphate-binding protein [Candidatus Eremiobacteraeota bacterium]
MRNSRRTFLSGVLASATVLSAHVARGAEEKSSVEVQNAREDWVKAKGHRVYYTRKFNLDDLPSYKPEQNVSGTIRMWGSNYFTDSPLAEWWEAEFRKYQPGVTFDFHLRTSEHAISSLIYGKSDLSPMGRQIMWDEQLAFQREYKYLPLGIVAVTGSYDVSGWNPPIGVYVNKDNPLAHMSLPQMDGVFGAPRSGAWRDLTWDKSLARGPEKNIRTWGQLGLTGQWANKPIRVYGYNLQFHFPQEIESRAFGGVSDKWNENLIEYDNQLLPNGRFKLAGEQMLEDLAKDPLGIAYCAGGNAWLTPQIKTLALGAKDGGPFYDLTLENVRNRTYPMYADVFFFMNRDPKKPADPKLREFMRYILSREGQAQVVRDGKYLPLTADVVREQRKKLD